MLDDRLCNIPTMIQIQFVTCFPFFTWTNALNFAFKWLYNSWLLLIIGLLWSFGNNQIMPYLVSSSLLLSLCKVIREISNEYRFQNFQSVGDCFPASICDLFQQWGVPAPGLD